MKTKYLCISLLLLVIYACKTDTEKKITKASNTTEISLLDTLQLKLNKGKKWQVNPETQGGVEKMNTILKAFKKNTNKNYNALGKNLSSQTSYIIKNCNMVGEPHDQLHVVLVPMLEEISNLKESKNNKEAEKYVMQLEGLIKDYFNHFKL
ncbi:MAG: hypothetical protein ACPG6B_07305 [Oceanihabitans sp.]